MAKPWDPKGGTDPHKFEGGDGSPNEDSLDVMAEHNPNEDWSEEIPEGTA